MYSRRLPNPLRLIFMDEPDSRSRSGMGFLDNFAKYSHSYSYHELSSISVQFNIQLADERIFLQNLLLKILNFIDVPTRIKETPTEPVEPT